MSKIYKQFIQLSIKETNNLTKKWVEDVSRRFSKDIQIAKRHVKRCSISLIIREKQIKTTMRHRLIPVRMATIKKSTNNKTGEGASRRGPPPLGPQAVLSGFL